MLYEQIDTAVIDGESLPWVPLTPYSEEILLKYFKLDPIRGEWIVLMKVPLGVQLPKHHHTGTVMVYTIEGKWKYEEHDWVAGPGSLVYETAASTHTFEVVTEGESGFVLTLVQVNGDLLFLDDKDNIVALENWKTSLNRYVAYCEQHGLVVELRERQHDESVAFFDRRRTSAVSAAASSADSMMFGARSRFRATACSS